MDIEIHVIPTQNIDARVLPLIQKKVKIHTTRDYAKIKGMPVISFCNGQFLKDIQTIRALSSHVMWVNCMTWTFPNEIKAHQHSMIDTHLFQTEHGKEKICSVLRKKNPNINAKIFVPFFNTEHFKFHIDRNTSIFTFGRISRDDRSKYMKETLQIYEMIDSPIPKKAIILGCTATKQPSIGNYKADWLDVLPPMGITQEEFYNRCDAVVQTSTLYENLPRVGMEAMASRSVLIVYNNNGWRCEVKHKKTGYLCTTPRDFVHYATTLAHSPLLRLRMAENARKHLEVISGLKSSISSWENIFNSF